ncbi:hypothetical protein [Clostridium sp.]|uniref:hypothetical protein n=1 Tax=Clostridium sp. TaxID=1506 RepID=UPI001D7507BB|nr:hypothetical protein [Clostridium sp.]MBS5938648.1 hypothetical protein [Clostridium sp.]
MKKGKIDDLLSSLTKEELIFMVRDLINEYEGLEEKILFKYVKLEEDEEIKKNKKYLSDIVKRYGSGRRFVSWRECGKFAEEVSEVLSSAQRYYFDTSKALVAIDTSIAVIRKMISAIQYMDDSNGDIGNVINESILLIGETCINTSEFSQKEKTQIFNKLLNEADNTIYDGWEDWRLSVINNCIYFCDDEKLRIKFQNKLDNMLENYSDDWSGRYNKEKLLGIKLKIISNYGADEEENEFIESNIKYSGFRELLINKCIENNEYDRVLKLAEEGELHDKEYKGLVSKWKQYRYIAYKNLNIVDKKKELARELFLNGDMSFYNELKEIHINDWGNYYLELKKEFKENKLDRLNIYSEMLIKENDLAELLQFCKEDVRRIEIYDELLIKDYRDDVNVMYKFLIEKMSEMASNRKEYKKVCKVIKRYINLLGEIDAYKIVKELKKKYQKRPAFIDELGKI